MSGAADPLLSTSDLEDFDEDGHPEELRPGDVPVCGRALVVPWYWHACSHDPVV